VIVVTVAEAGLAPANFSFASFRDMGIYDRRCEYQVNLSV